MYGYQPENVLEPDKFITVARVERDSEGQLFVIAGGEMREGLTRTLTQKTVNATTDNTFFKHTWESIWNRMNTDLSFETMSWDSYGGDLGVGDPATDTP